MTPIDPDLHTRLSGPNGRHSYGFPLQAHVYGPTGYPMGAAIAAYIAYRDDPVMEPAPTPDQVRLIAQYCQHYISAPLFTYPADELRRLRREVETIRTVRDLADWLWDCRRIGIEPL